MQNEMSKASTDIQRVPLIARIRALAEEVIEDDSYFVVDLVIRGFERSRAIEIFIDGDHGINVDVLAGISRRLGFIIDSEDVVAGKYTLTVSSPGNKYAFQLPRQYGKHVGKKLDLRINASDMEKETETVQGTLTSVSDKSVVLKGLNEELREIKFENITEAKVVLPW